MPRLLDLLDAFILSSTWEGLPNAVINAYAIGKSIVATNVGVTSWRVQEGIMEFLVPSCDSIVSAENNFEFYTTPSCGRV